MQGALDFVPDHSKQRVTVAVNNGLYEEIVYARNKDNVTLLGESQDKTILRYANNEVFNPHPANIRTNPEAGTFPSRRAAVAIDGAGGRYVEGAVMTSVPPYRIKVPLLLGGDHALAIGSIAAVARHCRRRGKDLVVLWLDAHADYNVPATSPSGNIHGMPAAVVSGHGHPRLLALGDACPMVAPGAIVQVGVRSVDPEEKALVVRSGSVTHDMRQVDELGIRRVVERVLERVSGPDTHLHVSFDVDFLDPGIAPGVATVVPGGPNYREAQLCMEMLHDSGAVGSVDLVELNPAADERNRSARLAVELVQSLFGKRILV